MNVLIVHAHPEPKSFCSALKDTAVQTLAAAGHHVEVSDLYALNFNPVGGRGDFHQQLDEHFRYQREQGAAWEKGLEAGFSAELATEVKKLQKADLVILNFPLWWFGLPAILKGWMDRVLILGFAYGHGAIYDKGLLSAKTALCCLTTGGGAELYGPDGLNGHLLDNVLWPVNHGTLYYTGMKTLAPQASHMPGRSTPEQREAMLQRWADRLATLAGEPGLW